MKEKGRESERKNTPHGVKKKRKTAKDLRFTHLSDGKTWPTLQFRQSREMKREQVIQSIFYKYFSEAHFEQLQDRELELLISDRNLKRFSQCDLNLV